MSPLNAFAKTRTEKMTGYQGYGPVIKLFPPDHISGVVHS